MVDDAWSEADLAVLSRQVLGGRPVVDVRPLTGGYRNANTRVTCGDGERYVLRRYRDGAACVVERDVLARLSGGPVPVPEVLYADPAGALFSSALLVTRFVPGVPGDRVLAGGAAEDSAALGRAMGTALAAVHAVTFPAPGFLGPGLTVSGGSPATGLGEYVARELPAGNAAAAFDPAELAALTALANRQAPLVERVSAQSHLVHGDYNPKNVLAERHGDGWRLTAVLDWEFALVATPLFDVGNVLRFAPDRPPGFEEGFVTGYTEAGGVLPDGWREISRAVDLFALVQFLTHPPEHRYFQKSVRLLRSRLSAG